MKLHLPFAWLVIVPLMFAACAVRGRDNSTDGSGGDGASSSSSAGGAGGSGGAGGDAGSGGAGGGGGAGGSPMVCQGLSPVCSPDCSSSTVVDASCDGAAWSCPPNTIDRKTCSFAEGCCKLSTDCANGGPAVACVADRCKETLPAPQCWSDEVCPAGTHCEGPIVCPCGQTCFAPDTPGICKP